MSSWYLAGVSVTTAWPSWSATSARSWPNCARSAFPTSGTDRGRRDATSPLLPDVFLRDLFLELHDSVQQGLRPGRAPGHVGVHRDELVDPLRHRVAVPVGTPAVGAAAERDDVLGVGHLVVD